MFFQHLYLSTIQELLLNVEPYVTSLAISSTAIPRINRKFSLPNFAEASSLCPNIISHKQISYCFCLTIYKINMPPVKNTITMANTFTQLKKKVVVLDMLDPDDDGVGD